MLDRRWGPFTIDRFADHHNALLPRFNSQERCPGGQLDAFAQTDWETERSFCHPPWHALSRLAQLLREVPRAEAVVIAPNWPAQP